MRLVVLILIFCFYVIITTGVQASKPRVKEWHSSEFFIDALSYTNSPTTKKRWELCDQSKDCKKLAEAIYFEARGEGWVGMVAVGHVIMNRVKSKKYRNSVKDVIERPYQFSYIKEVKNKTIREPVAYRKCLSAAYSVMSGASKDNTKGATHYFKKSMPRYPKWSRSLERTVAINNHLFFRG
jgi:spore germination cell wall hydrolase CwlJ-like protein